MICRKLMPFSCQRKWQRTIGVAPERWKCVCQHHFLPRAFKNIHTTNISSVRVSERNAVWGGSNWQGKHVEETRGGQKTPLLFAQCHVQSPQMKNTSVNDYYVWNVCRCVCFRLTSDGTKSSEELRKMLLHTDKELQLFIAASSRGQQCKCTSATGQCCYWSFDHSNIIFPPVSKLCSSHSLPAPPVKHLHHPQMSRCLLSALSLPLALFHHSD